MDEAPERRPMDLPLLIGIAVAGAIIGLLASLGALPGMWELAAWLAVATGAVIAALRRIPGDVFRHIAFGFMLAGFVGADVKALMWDSFLATHQGLLDQAMAEGVETVTRTGVIISDTIRGVLFGFVVGAVAAYLARRTPRTRDVEPDQDP